MVIVSQHHAPTAQKEEVGKHQLKEIGKKKEERETQKKN